MNYNRAFKFLFPPLLLFVVLSPGFLLHLPIPDEEMKYLSVNSGNTSIEAILFHAVVYVIILSAVYYMMGVRFF